MSHGMLTLSHFDWVPVPKCAIAVMLVSFGLRLADPSPDDGQKLVGMQAGAADAGRRPRRAGQEARRRCLA